MPISATMNSGFRSGESSCPSPPLAFGRMRYKTGVVVEQPEVGDGITHEQELDVFQIFGVSDVGIDFSFAPLPVFHPCRRLGRNKLRTHGGNQLGNAIVDGLWRSVHILSILVSHNAVMAKQVLAGFTGVAS